MRAAYVVVLTAFLLSGCSITWPVAVITDKGQTLKGSATASITGGSFQATDGKLTCSGSYDSMSTSTTITMPVLCSDGRKGIVMATRDAGGNSGSGRIRMEDGSSADFVFGRAAEAF